MSLSLNSEKAHGRTLGMPLDAETGFCFLPIIICFIISISLCTYNDIYLCYTIIYVLAKINFGSNAKICVKSSEAIVVRKSLWDSQGHSTALSSSRPMKDCTSSPSP